jgi:hypothetical protein
LKRSLASRFRDDRDAYAEAKTTFIEGVLAMNATEAAPESGEGSQTTVFNGGLPQTRAD